VYSAYINRLSFHLSPQVPSLFHFACSPPTETTLEIISEDSSRSPSHANAKPCSGSLLPFTNTRMDGITRDESDRFAARGCLRYQTKISWIPGPFGFYLLSSPASPCHSYSTPVYACARRANGQWGRPLEPACMRPYSIGLHVHEASNGHRVATITIPYHGHIATNFPVDKNIKNVSSQPKAL
jgi:hypothetical protein